MDAGAREEIASDQNNIDLRDRDRSIQEASVRGAML